MAGTWEIIGYVVLTLIFLLCCRCCRCFFPSEDGEYPLFVLCLVACALGLGVPLLFLILSPLWLPFYPFLDKNDDLRNSYMKGVVNFYLYLFCLLLSPAWLPALWIEMCMEKYENETWPKFESGATLLLNDYTWDVCFLIFIPVILAGFFIYVILGLIITALVIIAALLKLITCGKIDLFCLLEGTEMVSDQQLDTHLDTLRRAILLVLYILTGPIWFPFWFCRSCCFSKADSDKELEKDNNDTPAKKDDDNFANGDAAATDGGDDVAVHNAEAEDGETYCGSDSDFSGGVDHEDNFVVDDQVDEEKGLDHGGVGTTTTTKSKETTVQDEESGRDNADQERGTENRLDNVGPERTKYRSRCEIDNGSADETIVDKTEASSGAVEKTRGDNIIWI